VSGWRKCDTCRKVRQVDEFDGGSPTCRGCLTAPVKRRAAPVTKKTTTPRPAAAPAAPAGPRRPLLGSVGSGDLEVRERRAKRAALDALAALHPEEYALLLRDARQAEGLRPSAQPDVPAATAPASKDAAPNGSAPESGSAPAAES
jgi:hypothetical protein